jgi:Calx-beta domain/Domain of unknown function (DUF4114)
MSTIRFAGSSTLSLESSVQFALWDLVRESIASMTDRLQTFAQRSDFAEQMTIAFGGSPSGLQQAWSDGLVTLPNIEIRSQSELSGAQGAFAVTEQKIYLSLEFLQGSDRSAIESVVLEEYGHYLDALINTIDSPGDEGAIFTAIVQGNELSPQRLENLRLEDDTAVVSLDDKSVAIEQAAGFQIDFDYRFDTNGFFTSDRRATLEAAGDIWESLLFDDFTDIPAGTRLSIISPQTDNITSFDSDFVIDDLVIFVGARHLDGSRLGLGGPYGSWVVGSDLETRFTGSDFEPWIGRISFSQDANWFFDSTPSSDDDIPNDQNDFLSIALHEIGHVLGFGISNAFTTLVNGSVFTGLNATLANNNSPPPLDLDLAHLQDGLRSDGRETLMDPVNTRGERTLPTTLDLAVLADIGYELELTVPTVTIAATPDTTTETSQGTITLTATASAAVAGTQTIALTFSGAGIDTSDFGGSFPTQITIADGQTSGSVTLTIANDTIEEADLETVTFTISNPSAGLELGTVTTATVTIADDDVPTLTLAIDPTTFSENGGTATGTITRNSSSGSLTVNLNSSDTGEATAPNSVTIADGQTSATFTVTGVDETIVDGDQTVSITASANGFNTRTSNVTVTDDDVPTLTLAIDPTTFSENQGTATGTITRNSSSGSLTVNLSSSDTGEATVPSSVTIADGQTSVNFTVTGVDESTIDGDQPVTIAASANGFSTVTEDITITDDDVPIVTIAATNSSVQEEVTELGQFTLTLSKVVDINVTINYSIGGIATTGEDYTVLTGTVTIAAGETTKTIDITPIADLLFEADETLIVTLENGQFYDLGTTTTATMTILNNDPVPTVTIAATTATTNEDSTTPGQFTLTLSEVAGVDITVNYSIGGTAENGEDYTVLTGTATIAAGETTETIDITPITDLFFEANEAVILTLTAGETYELGDTPTATVTISEPLPTVTIAATDPLADEAEQDPGKFTVTLSEAASFDIQVGYTVSGTASNLTDAASDPADDYEDVALFVVIAAGTTTATIDLVPLDDTIELERDETVTLTLTDSPGYTLGEITEATVTIVDDDVPTVTIVATEPEVAEGDLVPGLFTFTLSEAVEEDITLRYIVSGTATSEQDFTSIQDTLTIEAGSLSATIDVQPINDRLTEGAETVIITLADGSTYNLGSTTTATVTIADNDRDNVIFDADSRSRISSVFAYDFTPAEDGTQITTQLTADLLDLGTDAVFDNLIGLYAIADNTGGIDTDGDGTVDLLPSSPEYARHAVRNRVDAFFLRAGSSGDPSRNTTVEQFGNIFLVGGQLYAPFVIANGGALGFAGFLAVEEAETDGVFNDAADFVNDRVTYFAFSGANPDRAAHLQSRGNNIFGFEDLPGNLGGSDNDFNDAIFQFTFSTVG